MQDAVTQIGNVCQVVENIGDTGAYKAGSGPFVGVDHRQVDELVKAGIEAIDTPVDPFDRVMNVQCAQAGALELVALALVDLDTLQRVLVFGNGFLSLQAPGDECGRQGNRDPAHGVVPSRKFSMRAVTS